MMAIASAGMSMATGAMQAQAQYDAQDEAFRAQEERFRINAENAIRAAEDDHKQLNMRSMQEQDKTREEQRVGAIQSEQRAAGQTAAAAGAGVTGLSVDNLVADVYRTEGTNQMIRETNMRSTVQQLQANKTGAVNTAQSRINSVARGTPPSQAALNAGIATAVVGGIRQLPFQQMFKVNG